MGRLHVLPQPGPGVSLPAAGQTLPAPGVKLGHLSLYVTVKLIWNIGFITQRPLGFYVIDLENSPPTLRGNQTRETTLCEIFDCDDYKH